MYGFHYVERSKYVTPFAGPQVDITNHLEEVPNGVLEAYDDFAGRQAPWGFVAHASAELAARTSDTHQALIHAIHAKGLPIRLDNPQTARQYIHLTKGLTADEEGRMRLPESFGTVLKNKNQQDGITYTTTAHVLGELSIQPVAGILDNGQSRVSITMHNESMHPMLDVTYNLFGGGYATLAAATAYPQGDHPAVGEMWFNLNLDQVAPPISFVYPNACNPAMFTLEDTQIGPHQLRALTRHIRDLPQSTTLAA